jgi:deoxyribodipyrimidine photo-lyase
MTTAIVWLRRDLRLHDNPALYHAARLHDAVIPVFIHAPQEETPWMPGAASRWWLHHSLQAFEAALYQQGSQLILRQGESLAQLWGLIKASGATAVYWNRLYDPALRQRDQHIKQALRADGVQAESFNGALLWEPWQIKKQSKQQRGEPYQVFTPYWKAARQQIPAAPLPIAELAAPKQWPERLSLAALELLPRLAWDGGLQAAWQVGETAAWQRLATVLSGIIDDYLTQRNYPAQDGVSRLSPYLHHGELSPRQIWQAVVERYHGELQAPAEAYLRELGWREFAHQVLFHWPHTPDKPLQGKFQRFPWRNDDYSEPLRRWQRGQTGIPLVDAGMRELWQTGWMHNRVRMVVASFLTKNLLIPWQEGARWFWDTLVDADLANNSMGWQWTAGCGVDAAPYFRVFNPVRQGEQYDPDGIYIRRWLPELADMPSRYLQQPWTVPQSQQGLLSNYPPPLVDLAKSRGQALAAYQSMKS